LAELSSAPDPAKGAYSTPPDRYIQGVLLLRGGRRKKGKWKGKRQKGRKERGKRGKGESIRVGERLPLSAERR